MVGWPDGRIPLRLPNSQPILGVGVRVVRGLSAEERQVGAVISEAATRNRLLTSSPSRKFLQELPKSATPDSASPSPMTQKAAIPLRH